MPFQKSLKVTKNKIDGLIEKEKSLTNDLEKVSRKVEKRKNEVSALLGKIALGENRIEDQKDLDSLKTLHQKAIEEQADIKVMIELVRGERSKLLVEIDEATLRESPQEMEAVASKFNSKLADAMKNLETLENDFKELHDKETEFISLANGRKNSLSRLGKLDDMELKESLGKLAMAPPPHSLVFTTGTEVKVFVGNLLGYRTRLAGYEKFTQDNPSFEENVRETQTQQKEKPWARMTNWDWLRQ